MDRRKFIKSSSFIALPLLLKSCYWMNGEADFQIRIHSDAQAGHLIRQKQTLPKGNNYNIETLIVGGGIAGLSAAHSLGGKDFLICELAAELGGSSSSSEYKGIRYTQGAHYDLAYPKGYGEDVINLLEQLDVISYQPWSQIWGFKDREHIIFNRSKNQCFDNGKIRKDVLEEGQIKEQFLKLIDTFKGEMHLPSRLIENRFYELNQISFLDYLKKHITLDEKFIRGIDYHMKDDYGAGSQIVSALAGIHYFKCRPYYDQVVELFSPPQGNKYFIDKMALNLPQDQIKTNSLVCHIKEVEKGFEAEIINTKEKSVDSIRCRNIIYAGQKHALKFVYPEAFELFQNNQYAPWMVVNLVVKDELPTPAFWQNEILTSDHTFMGFVDSATQHRKNLNYRTLSGYYCLPQSSRNDLLNVESNRELIVRNMAIQVGDYFGKDIHSLIQFADIKVMGHAMPIPTLGYMFDDRNLRRKKKNLVFAGVDNGRLPLLYEALDSGIQAVKILNSLK